MVTAWKRALVSDPSCSADLHASVLFASLFWTASVGFRGNHPSIAHFQAGCWRRRRIRNHSEDGFHGRLRAIDVWLRHGTLISMTTSTKNQTHEHQRPYLTEVRHDRHEEGAGQYLLFTRAQLLPTPSRHSKVLEEIRRTYICPEELFFIPATLPTKPSQRKGNAHV